jgi:hypothetical protein
MPKRRFLDADAGQNLEGLLVKKKPRRETGQSCRNSAHNSESSLSWAIAFEDRHAPNPIWGVSLKAGKRVQKIENLSNS